MRQEATAPIEKLGGTPEAKEGIKLLILEEVKMRSSLPMLVLSALSACDPDCI